MKEKSKFENAREIYSERKLECDAYGSTSEKKIK
jgi:hypothetical protein